MLHESVDEGVISPRTQGNEIFLMVCEFPLGLDEAPPVLDVVPQTVLLSHWGLVHCD